MGFLVYNPFDLRAKSDITEYDMIRMNKIKRKN